MFSKSKNIIYIGLNINTLFVLSKESSFNIVGVGLLEDLLDAKSLNPINVIFKIIYKLRLANRFRLLEKILLFFWSIVKNGSTSIFRRYRNYLYLISSRRYNVIDLNGEGYKLENGYWYYNNFFITLDEYRDTRIEYLIKK